MSLLDGVGEKTLNPDAVPPKTAEYYQKQYAIYARKTINPSGSSDFIPFKQIKMLIQENLRQTLQQTEDQRKTLMAIREIDLAIFERYLREHQIDQQTCIEGIMIIKHSAFLEILTEECGLNTDDIPAYLETIYDEVQQRIQKAIKYGKWKAEHLTPLLKKKQ